MKINFRVNAKNSSISHVNKKKIKMEIFLLPQKKQQNRKINLCEKTVFLNGNFVDNKLKTNSQDKKKIKIQIVKNVQNCRDQ